MKICPVCEKEWPDESTFCPDDGTTLRSSAEAPDLVGSLIAERYRVLKKLGEGGMGAVYLGEHVKMGLKVAIKIISHAMAEDVAAIARFNREARNAARIKHPNVCSVTDFGETADGMVFLVMEYVEGESLTALLHQTGPLPVARTARIFAQCCEALQAAHDLNIVHRDLKPDNIMVSRNRDGTDQVKIVDFGIAKAMMANEGQTVTKTGHIIGTPEYMSPEQVSGEKLDGRSDTYSLALVLFRMLTGELPFVADTPQASLVNRLVHEPLSLAEAAPQLKLPHKLQELMDRALSRTPEGRFPNVVEFGRNVADALVATVDEDGPIDVDAPTYFEAETIKPTVPSTPSPQPSRLKLWLGLGGGIVAAGVIGWVILGGGAAERNAPPSEAPVPDLSLTPIDTNSPAPVKLTQGEIPDEAAKEPADPAPAQEGTGSRPGGAAAPTGGKIDPSPSQEPRKTKSRASGELAEIDKLVDQGRVRTALERLDQLHKRNLGDRQVNALIEKTVRKEIDGLVAGGDHKQAIAKLSKHIKARPYLEHMERDLKKLHVNRLKSALNSGDREGAGSAASQLSKAFPRDAALLYEAATLMADGGHTIWALKRFDKVLSLNSSYRNKDNIRQLAESTLSKGWISNTEHAARELLGKYYIDDVRAEMIKNLNSNNDNLRLNSYNILKQHAQGALAKQNLFEFHRLNVAHLPAYRNYGQPFDWAIAYFVRLNNDGQINRAVAALTKVVNNKNLPGASSLPRKAKVTIDQLKSATVTIRTTNAKKNVVYPSRTGYEFHFDWMDETLAGAQNWAAQVVISLEIDGKTVADHKGKVKPPVKLPRAKDCTRLGTRWFNVETRKPRQCTHRVSWRYHQPKLPAGEHSWTLRSSYKDTENGKDSYEEQFSGTFRTKD